MPKGSAGDLNASGWTVGHRAAGARPFAFFAGGTPAHGWVGAGSNVRSLAHGVNAAGLIVAVDGDPELPAIDGLVLRLLEQTRDAAAAREMLTDEWSSRQVDVPAPVVSVVSDGRGWSVALGGVGPRPTALPGEATARDRSLRFGVWRGDRPLSDVESDLVVPASAPTTAPRSVLTAGRGQDRPLVVLLGLGSPLTAIPIRVWPGYALAPPAGRHDAHPYRLGELAAEVDALVTRGVLKVADVQSALTGVRAAVLAEGAHAEHQAQLMDSYGDDSGATVRRLVAQSHAVNLAETALRGLLEGASGNASL